MTTSDYRPIGCDAHSVLEVLALRRVEAVLAVVDEQGVAVIVAGRVVDLLTRAGSEYLRVCRDDGELHDIRLDRLRTITTPAGGELRRQESGATHNRY